MKKKMDAVMERLEQILELGGAKKDVVLLIISGAALLASIFGISLFGTDPRSVGRFTRTARRRNSCRNIRWGKRRHPVTVGSMGKYRVM